MTIGDRIKIQRDKANLSQTELAKKINVSKQTLYKYESNIITNIPSDKIEAIAHVLGVTPSYLMGWDDENASPEDSLDRYDIETLRQLNDDNAGKVNTYATNLLSVQRLEEPVLAAAHIDKSGQKDKMIQDAYRLREMRK